MSDMFGCFTWQELHSIEIQHNAQNILQEKVSWMHSATNDLLRKFPATRVSETTSVSDL